jgi:hypothetical protein
LILSAHQPAYIPWLGYFNKMMRSDIFVLLDDVQFERNSFTNRNLILVGGKPHWLTVPISMKGHTGKTIRQMEIDYSTDWRRKHWETIRYNYCHAPYWDENHGFVQSITDGFYGNISRFTLDWLPYFSPKDFYVQSGVGIKGHKLELIVNLCRYFKADSFLFGTEGYDTYGKDIVEYGITPIRQEFTAPDNPPLSVLHYLMTVGVEETRKMICP